MYNYYCILYKYFTKYVLIQIFHKIKAICLNKLCFKFEVDI